MSMFRCKNKHNKQDKTTVSVILPVYNVERWIGECIESLKKQKLPGLEFVFVDDCGTDNSMLFVEAWANEDERVRIIHNDKNMGAGASRNAGIEAAQGEYLSFVDTDDWLSSDFYMRLYDKAERTGCDIIKGRRLPVEKQPEQVDRKSTALSKKTNKRIRLRFIKKAPLYTCFINEHQSAIYKSTLFHDNKVRYGSTDYSEDVTFLLKVCHKTESIAIVDDAVYYYRQHPRSATSAYTFDRSMEELKALEESVDFLEDKHVNDWAFLYLKGKIRARLKNYYFATRDYNISEEQQHKYVEKFRKLINKLDHHPLLFRDYPQLGVFLKTGQIINPKPKISVIIPMYKCSDFIDDLLDSVCNQSLRDTEIICVLDGEDEDILKAIEKRSESDGRIICIEQLHSGAGTARNTGLEIARGDYLLFLDADDIFATHMFETMYEEAVKWDADIVMCSYTETNEWDKTTHTNKGYDHDLMPENRVLDPSVMPKFLASFIGAPWNKLFRRKMIEKNALRFSNTRIMNDEFFVTTAMICSKKLVTIHQDLLTVRRQINRHSISTNRSKYTQDCVVVMNQIYRWLRDRCEWRHHRQGYYKKFKRALEYQSRYEYNEDFIDAVARTLSIDKPWKNMSNSNLIKALDMDSTQAKKAKERLESEKASAQNIDFSGLEKRMQMLDNQIYAKEQIRASMKSKYGRDLAKPDNISRRLLWFLEQ